MYLIRVIAIWMGQKVKRIDGFNKSYLDDNYYIPRNLMNYHPFYVHHFLR